MLVWIKDGERYRGGGIVMGDGTRNTNPHPEDFEAAGYEQAEVEALEDEEQQDDPEAVSETEPVLLSPMWEEPAINPMSEIEDEGSEDSIEGKVSEEAE